jgi:Beta-propeller repeat
VTSMPSDAMNNAPRRRKRGLGIGLAAFIALAGSSGGTPASAIAQAHRPSAVTSVAHAHARPSINWYSSHFGGSQWDGAYPVTVDRSGNIYLGGATESVDFPALHAFQARHAPKTRSFAGGPVTNDASLDGFIVKLSPRGKMIYSTYLGGSFGESVAAIAVDDAGNAYVAGSTHSPDFPVVNALQKRCSGSTTVNESISGPCLNAFVAKLDPRGRVLFSTFLGGRVTKGGIQVLGKRVVGTSTAGAIGIDRQHDIYLAGTTGNAGFPGTAGHGLDGGFVAKLSPAGNRVLATYADFTCGCGQNPEWSTGLAVGPDGTVMVAMNNLLVRLDPSLRPKLRVKLYADARGRTTHSDVLALAGDRRGDAYITGYTDDPGFRVYHAVQSRLGGGDCSTNDYAKAFCTDAFLMEIDPTGHTVFSTFLGGSTNDVGDGVAVDRSDNVYVVGATNGSFPIKNPFQPSSAGAFVAKFSPGGKQLLYSSYLGASKSDLADAVAPTSTGDSVVTGETSHDETSDVFVTRLPAVPPALTVP